MQDATEDIVAYTNDNFIEEYDDYTFDIEKYDILAIDDGFKFRIDIDSEEDNKLTSIFTIVKEDLNDQHMHYENGSNKIRIYLSPDYYDSYNSMKNSSNLNNIVFAILLIPTLAACLSEIKTSIDDVDDIEDIIEQKKWFKSVCLSFEKAKCSKLPLEDFREWNSLELAQLVLNNSTCNGLNDFSNMLFNGMEGGAEDE